MDHSCAFVPPRLPKYVRGFSCHPDRGPFRSVVSWAALYCSERRSKRGLVSVVVDSGGWLIEANLYRIDMRTSGTMRVTALAALF